MAEKTFVLYNFIIQPGQCVEVEGFIVEDCKQFSIDLGTDDKNLVLNYNPRFDYLGYDHKILLRPMKGGFYGAELVESFFPFQEGSDTMVCFQFEKDKITIQLPTGNPYSFPVRFPIEEISYLAVKELHPKSITLK